MENQTTDRLEIFLALALNQAAKRNHTEKAQAQSVDFVPSAEVEVESPGKDIDAPENDFLFPILEHLTVAETKRFKLVRAEYQDKAEDEKRAWREQILNKIKTDNPMIDDDVHWSHVQEALQKEVPAVQKIIINALSSVHQNSIRNSVKSKKASEKSASPLEKVINRTFAKQFVALKDLPKPAAFDRLSGRQLVHLIRLSGIREVALACVRIEAVESVAAFLRRFSAEDARAVAAHLNGLRDTPEARLAFAENLVQTTLESEPNPSVMLDLLGIHLIGVFLCASSETRVLYTNQKLPLEIAPKLPEIIDAECRQTNKGLQREISAEIEQLVETIARTTNNGKQTETKKISSKL